MASYAVLELVSPPDHVPKGAVAAKAYYHAGWSTLLLFSAIGHVATAFAVRLATTLPLNGGHSVASSTSLTDSGHPALNVVRMGLAGARSMSIPQAWLVVAGHPTVRLSFELETAIFVGNAATVVGFALVMLACSSV